MKVDIAIGGYCKEVSEMELPEIDLKELEEIKKRNFEDRLRFIEIYVRWLKKNKIVRIEKVEKK